MPVSRRSCDYCRAHKLKCQWIDASASCVQCRSRNKPCLIPSLPSNTNGVLERNHEGSDITTQPKSLTGGSVLTSTSPVKSANFDDRIKRLEDFIDEFKRLPTIATNAQPLYQPVRSQHRDTAFLASSSPANKRTFDQIVALDDHEDNIFCRPRFRADDPSSLAVDISDADPRTFFRSARPVAHEVMPTETDEGRSQPSLFLSNCAKGNCFLPFPNEGYSLLTEYLHDFNSTIPLFHPETLYTYVRDCYSGAADKTPLLWVLAYIALGIGHRLRAMSLFGTAEDTHNAEWYLNKCLAVLPDLLLHEPSLLLIQALLGVSILLQTSDRFRKAALFVSTAMHMAQDLAYNEATPGASSRSKEEFYVFWIAFHMDTAMSLAASRPNTQRLVEISASLPNHGSSDWWASNISEDHTAAGKVNIFALHAGLALIQAEAIEELFSVKARQRSASLRASTFSSILSKLEAWRRNNPTENVPSMLEDMYQSDIVHLVILEASYFGTLYQLHATNALGAFTHRVDAFSPKELRAAGVLISLELYTDAQRLLDQFAALISQGNMSVVTWATIHALIAALCMVLACHLRRNEAGNTILTTPSFATNTHHYRKTLGALENAAAKANDSKLTQKVEVCTQLYAQVKMLNEAPLGGDIDFPERIT